ncbi:carboxypeptidase-like regulatory domain-containing protein [Pedobacter sp. NJ-S-72]
MNKPILFLMTTLLSGNIVFAQKHHEIDGVVVDEQNVTLPYVSLRVAGQAGTMTNADGGFVFKYEQTTDKDSLLVSYIGYKNLRIALSALHTNMKIRLEPAVVNLNEVVIRVINAESVIRQAIKNIPENYDTQPFLK